MSDTSVKAHPKLGILVCTDGHVFVPANYNQKEHWTLGCDNHIGYREDHRNIRVANGKKRWVPTELALESLKLPVKETIT